MDRLWSPLDFEDKPRLDLMLSKRVYLTPTLGPYAITTGDQDATPEQAAGFEKMVEFAGIAHRAGVPIGLDRVGVKTAGCRR